MKRKPFGDCPNCKGLGHTIAPCPFAAFDGLAKCSYCKGFGLASLTDIEAYHSDTQLIDTMTLNILELQRTQK